MTLSLRSSGAFLAQSRSDLLWKMTDRFLFLRGFGGLLNIPARGGLLFCGCQCGLDSFGFAPRSRWLGG